MCPLKIFIMQFSWTFFNTELRSATLDEHKTDNLIICAISLYGSYPFAVQGIDSTLDRSTVTNFQVGPGELLEL